MGSEMGSIVGVIGIIVCSVYLSRHVPRWNNAKELNNDKLIFEYDKQIVDIQYPSVISHDNIINNNNNNNVNFVECHCGEKCTSQLGICTKLFITDDYDNHIMIKNTMEGDDECTFREYECTTSLEERNYAILNNIIDIQKYINIMDNNSTIDVYKRKFNNKDVYFLNKTNYDTQYHLDIIITCSVFLVISVCVLQVSSREEDINKNDTLCARAYFV